MRKVVSALFVTAAMLVAGSGAAPAAKAANAPVAAPAPQAASCPAWLNQEYRKLHSSQKVNICQAFAGRPLLIVNTASHCGYTPQFKAVLDKHCVVADIGGLPGNRTTPDRDRGPSWPRWATAFRRPRRARSRRPRAPPTPWK
jgi:hypothetical protein